jgi:hypothetical protein
MAYLDDRDDKFGIEKIINDSIITDSNPVCVFRAD